MAIDHKAQADKVKSKLAAFGQPNISYHAQADLNNTPSKKYGLDADDAFVKAAPSDNSRMPVAEAKEVFDPHKVVQGT